MLPATTERARESPAAAVAAASGPHSQAWNPVARHPAQVCLSFKQRPGRIKGTPGLKGTGWRPTSTEAGLGGAKTGGGVALGGGADASICSRAHPVLRLPRLGPEPGPPTGRWAHLGPWLCKAPKGKSAYAPGRLSAREPTAGAGGLDGGGESAPPRVSQES